MHVDVVDGGEDPDDAVGSLGVALENNLFGPCVPGFAYIETSGRSRLVLLLDQDDRRAPHDSFVLA
jgi:hypothetical protein